MKTSLQEALQQIEEKQDLFRSQNVSQYWKGLQDACIILESLLEKEKQDLIDACQTGINKALDYSFEPQDYYNKTFKQ